MKTKPELNNVIINKGTGNVLPEPPKKIKNTKPKILIIKEKDIEIEKVETEKPINVIINKGTGAGC